MKSTASLIAAAACLALASAAHAQSSTGTIQNYEAGSSASGSASMGMDRETVRQVQQGLKDKGYDPGPVDGVMGSQTQSALREYQQSQGMNASGSMDAATMGALGVQNRSGSGAPSGQDKTTSPSLRPDSSTVDTSSRAPGPTSGSTPGATAPNRSGSSTPSGDDATTSPGLRQDEPVGTMKDSAGGSSGGSATTDKNRSGSGAPSGQDKTTSPPLRPDASTTGR